MGQRRLRLCAHLRPSDTARQELAGKTWDSIAKDGLPPLTQEQRELLDERISEADTNRQNRVPASAVFRNARHLN